MDSAPVEDDGTGHAVTLAAGGLADHSLPRCGAGVTTHEVRRWDWNQTYTASEYRQLVLSYSGTQMMNEPHRSGLVDDMELFIREQFDGSVTRLLVVTLTSASRT